MAEENMKLSPQVLLEHFQKSLCFTEVLSSYTDIHSRNLNIR